MEENPSVSYDAETDIFYILVRRGKPHQIVEAGKDITLELDENGEVMGIELLNAKRNRIFEQIQSTLG